jgi:RNA polymerase sigma factor (sigma-70 family)
MTTTGTRTIDLTDQARRASALVEAVRRSDQGAWAALVTQYGPLVQSVARRHRSAENLEDEDDVAQIVWLRLMEHLDRIREPGRLPGWIATTTRHESLRVIRQRGREAPLARRLTAQPSENHADDVDAGLLRDELRRVLSAALDQLPPTQRDLLLLLSADPPRSYQEISDLLGIPVGSIGPTRARALRRLRRSGAIRRYVGRSGS